MRTFANKRLEQMVADGKIELRGGQWIDAYNQITNPDIAGTIITRIDGSNHYWVMEEKEPTIISSRGREPQTLTPKRTEHGKKIRKAYEAHQVAESRKFIQQLEPRTDGITNTITGVQKDNLLAIPTNTKSGVIQMELGGVCDLSYPSSKTRRGRVQDGGQTTPALTRNTESTLRQIGTDFRIRKLTPRECFRLMGVKEPEIDILLNAGISNSQLYKLAGNSIVVNCLTAIFRQLFIGNFNENQQLEIF